MSKTPHGSTQQHEEQLPKYGNSRRGDDLRNPGWCPAAGPLPMLDEIVENTKSKNQFLSRLPHCVPDVVTFQVGEEHFALTKALIEKDPQSLLFVLASNHYAKQKVAPAVQGKTESVARRKRRRGDDVEFDERDDSAEAAASGSSSCSFSQVISIPDKDPDLFRKILNVVRGYKSAIPDDRWREACMCDVAFYGLEKSWQKLFPSPEQMQFSVKTNPHFISSATTCAVASPYYTDGVHVVTFALSLQGAEKVATGVETKDKDAATDSISQAAHGEAFNRALYWNDGNVTTFFTEPVSIASGIPYRSSTLIRVFLDADEGTVRWMVQGCNCVAMVRLPKKEAGYAFSVVSQKGARVDIVDID